MKIDPKVEEIKALLYRITYNCANNEKGIINCVLHVSIPVFTIQELAMLGSFVMNEIVIKSPSSNLTRLMMNGIPSARDNFVEYGKWVYEYLDNNDHVINNFLKDNTQREVVTIIGVKTAAMVHLVGHTDAIIDDGEYKF